MNITSVGGMELCNILLGKDSPYWKSSNEFVELNETVQGDSVDFSKVVVDPEKSKDFELHTEELGKLKKVDRFEYSDSITSDISKSTSSDYYGRVTERDLGVMDYYIKVSLGSGMINGIPTKERIAEYYGDMAKRLDTAYSEGKFTKDEYDELNGMLLDHMEYITVCAERNKAFYAIGKEHGSLSPAAAKEATLKKLSMSSEEYMAEMNAKISEYVEKYFKIDRVSLLELFNKIRYAK